MGSANRCDMTGTKDIINATDNSIDIIELIKSKNGARVSDIARELELSKSTVHKHLTTLHERGYVTKQGEIYHVGLKFFHIGQQAQNRDERYTLAKEMTMSLAEQLNYAVDFDTESNGRIITLFHESNESTEIGFKEGDYFYAHVSATGKAMLSVLPDDRVEAIINKWGMPEKTSNTITEMTQFMNELQTTRERGYSIVDEEWLKGHRAVGVVVTLRDGTPFGALSAGGPTYRLTDERIRNEVAPTLTQAATHLESEISEVVVT